MKITKSMLVNYLVDVLGYSEEESKTIAVVYGTSYLLDQQKFECVEFNK